jgi:sialate O-acetylesterase
MIPFEISSVTIVRIAAKGKRAMRKNVRFSWLAILIAIIGFTTKTNAEVRLPKVFSSHMVLQQDKPIVVWGWANPNEEVSVEAGTSTGKTTANDKGEWKATLPALKAGGPAIALKVSGSNQITFDDVLVGEVWICSGQSNMEFGIGNALNAKAEIAAADEPEIRLLKVDKSWKPSPQTDMNGEWRVCTPKSVSEGGWNGFSAVGYFFGRELHKELGVPIGLIDVTWGGTVIQSWTPPEGFAAVPALSSDNEKLQLAVAGSAAHDQALTAAIASMDAWSADAKKSIADHTLPPPMPALAAGLFGPNDVQASTALFNGMIHPLCPLAIRGAIWYQGEANEKEGKLYTERMKALIGGWRTIWGEGEFPFYFVQIAPFNYGDKRPYLPEFWEAQAEAEKVIPNTGMIVVNDIGNLGDIHPKNKQDVGHRLAARALFQTYGKADVLGQSPTFKSMATEGSTLRVTFAHTGTGLSSRDGKPISWFEIADSDGSGFKKATATIDGASALLSAPEVKNPVAVRFAWAMLAEPNLMNSAGFPVSAFREGTVPPKDSVTQNVPELKNYKLVYDLDMSRLGADIHYTTDNHAAINGPFDRIAYAVELEDANGKSSWVYSSMDAFTNDITKIGVPTAASGAHFQQNIANLNVFSNMPGIVAGENLSGGNIEFWPNNYAPNNTAGVPNASNDTFDAGDSPTDPVDGYGCMQVHNHDAKQTLFAINHWREGGGSDLGIGNAPTGNPDWTFAANGDSYASKRLRVFVHLK